jgi:hypothetical protein
MTGRQDSPWDAPYLKWLRDKRRRQKLDIRNMAGAASSAIAGDVPILKMRILLSYKPIPFLSGLMMQLI